MVPVPTTKTKLYVCANWIPACAGMTKGVSPLHKRRPASKKPAPTKDGPLCYPYEPGKPRQNGISSSKSSLKPPDLPPPDDEPPPPEPPEPPP